jgi:hypothetical protein
VLTPASPATEAGCGRINPMLHLELRCRIQRERVRTEFGREASRRAGRGPCSIFLLNASSSARPRQRSRFITSPGDTSGPGPAPPRRAPTDWSEVTTVPATTPVERGVHVQLRGRHHLRDSSDLNRGV